MQIIKIFQSYFSMFRAFAVVFYFTGVIQGAPLSGNKHLKNVFPIGKIFGGQPIAVNEAPWQVSLEDSGYLFCGGSIISANYILTAAHCTDGTPAEYIQVRSGTNVLEAGGQLTMVTSIAQNPNFNSKTFDYDISILKLETPLIFGGNQSPVHLRKKEAVAGEIGLVTGWSTEKGGLNSLPITLQAVGVPIVKRTDCNEHYEGGVSARMICAGELGVDSCQGDSGGALTVANAQVGIVSWGYGCANKEYSGVYANIAALSDFINQHSNNEVSWV